MKRNLLQLSLAGLIAAGLGGGSAWADGIGDFQQSWSGKALSLQRSLEVYSPLADNSMMGTHNSFNSTVYEACDLKVGCRYQDPQQKHSIYDQLRMGARFIEMDAHWTTKMESLISYPKRLLLCHNGGKGVCSVNDKYLTEGLDELKKWLNSSDSDNQVVVLYIEDHMDGRHQDAYNQVNQRIGNWVYSSNGCAAIPASLTKAQVMAAGKKVLIFSGKSCSSNGSWANMVYTGLGDIGRVWEDRTVVGSLNSYVSGGSVDHLNASEVSTALREGANIVALDNMVTSDGRLAAGVWSWAEGEPNNNGGNQDCAVQFGSGRWDDRACSNSLPYACQNSTAGWVVTRAAGAFAGGQAACQAEYGNGANFRVPANALDNQKLKLARAAAGHEAVWLNHDDQADEGDWRVNGLSGANPAGLSSEVQAAAGGLTLRANQSINTRRRQLVMQGDGNLVLYRLDRGVLVGDALWASSTQGSGNYAVFQQDGNLVVYSSANKAKWDSNTHGSGTRLVLQSDGNLVIYDGAGRAKWDSGTNR